MLGFGAGILGCGSCLAFCAWCVACTVCFSILGISYFLVMPWITNDLAGIALRLWHSAKQFKPHTF